MALTSVVGKLNKGQATRSPTFALRKWYKGCVKAESYNHR